MRTKLRTLGAAIIVAFAPLASAAVTTGTTTEIEKQTTQLNTAAENKGQTHVATKIASSFGNLAGSDANTLKLVQALRNGTAVTLTTSTAGTGAGAPATTTNTTLTPPTGKMGWGNVFTSLALAKDVLARAGITDPTTAQLQAALTGGDVVGADGKTVALKGILQMRADGMGWGQIAHASGTKVGPVVSSIKSTHTKVASLPASTPSTGATTATTTAVGKSSSKGVTTAAGTSGVQGGNASKGITTASGASAGTVTAAGGSSHGNSANAPGRGVVTAAGGSASAAGVSNAGGNAKGNAGGGGNGKGKHGG
jgi:hypothetical protein